MDQCPAEIWERIFSFACTDAGSTGCSLSLVSRYFYMISKPVRLRSVALRGVAHMKHFVAHILDGDAQSEARTGSGIYHLFISHSSPADVRDPGGDYASEVSLDFATLMMRILRVVAPSLQTLTLHVGFTYPHPLVSLTFPNLTELTLFGAFSPQPHPEPSSAPLAALTTVQRLPSLTHLHLIDCCLFFPALRGQVPRLTHVRITGAMVLSSLARSAFSAALSLPSASQSRSPATRADAGYPPIVQMIIQPASRVGFLRASRYWLSAWADLTTNEKVVVLKVKATRALGLSQARRFWEERIVGEQGCWQVNPDDISISPGLVRRPEFWSESGE